jgi:hypothetical protein
LSTAMATRRGARSCLSPLDLRDHLTRLLRQGLDNKAEVIRIEKRSDPLRRVVAGRACGKRILAVRAGPDTTALHRSPAISFSHGVELRQTSKTEHCAHLRTDAADQPMVIVTSAPVGKSLP